MVTELDACFVNLHEGADRSSVGLDAPTALLVYSARQMADVEEDRMQTCLNAATLRQGLSLEEFITAAGAAGFAGIELRVPAAVALVEAHGLATLRQRLATAGLTPAAGGYPAPLRSTAAEFETALAAVPAACALMRELGIGGGTLVLPPRQGDGYRVERAETIERIGRVARLAASHGLDIYLEFLGLHFPDGLTWTKTLGDALDIANEVGLPNVGALIDSYHWHLGGSRTEDLARVAGRPVFVHINDSPPGDVTTLTDAMRVLPGEGILDLPSWLRAIRAATGYDGFVSLELFNEPIRALDPADGAARSLRSLAAVLAQV